MSHLWAPVSEVSFENGPKAMRPRSKFNSIIFIFLISLLTGSCASNSMTISDLVQRYGPTKSRWLGPSYHVGQVLVLGLVEDPNIIGNKYHNIRVTELGAEQGQPDYTWFNKFGLDNVELYIHPTTPVIQLWNFGPKFGEPDGVYEFKLLDLKSDRCRPYEIYLTAWKERIFKPNIPYKVLPEGKCLVYKYKGPLDAGQYEFLYYSYEDEYFSSRGYGVIITELRRGSDVVVARSVACAPNYMLKYIEKCEGTDRLVDDLAAQGQIK